MKESELPHSSSRVRDTIRSGLRGPYATWTMDGSEGVALAR